MNKRISEAFSHGKVFIPFVTCGDPSLEVTEEIVLGMAEAGADIIELGIPFSDPTAEGPVIQAANLRALSGGVTTAKVMELVRRLRKQTQVPLVFMTYANVVYSYGGTTTAAERKGTANDGQTAGSNRGFREENGTERFIREAAEAGIDGLILPDIPFEEKAEFAEITKKYTIDFISLIAPTSEARITKIAKEAEGFVYCVSSLGVTGERSEITTDIGAMVGLVKAAGNIPCAVGFGISIPEQAKKMAALSDGAIVGSAIVRIIGEKGAQAVPEVTAFVKSMKDAVNKGNE